MSGSRVFTVLVILATVFVCQTAFGQIAGKVSPASFTLAGNVTSSTGKPVSGALITLSGGAALTATTDIHGHYAFSLPAGSYTVTPSLSGYGFDPLSRSVNIVKANVTGQNFTTRSISGRVTILPGGKSLAGATMTLTGGLDVRTATTGSGGGYTLDNLSSGVYTITPSRTGYEFAPAARQVKVNKANVTGETFTAVVSTFVTGTAAAKQAIANSVVTLKDKKGAVRTSSTGTDGTFSVRSTGLTPPFLLMVESGGPTLYSVSTDGKAATTINLTPFTDMVIRSWYGVRNVDMATAFSRPDLNPPPSPANVMLIATVLKNMVRPWLVQAGSDADSFNLISTPFASDGTGVDKVLKASDVTVTGSTLSASITNGFTTQSATMTPVASSVTITSTATTPKGIGSRTVGHTMVPKKGSSGASALEGIASTIKAFVTTVNTRGDSLTAADLTPYVDAGYLEDGMNGGAFKTKIVNEMRGTFVSFAGLTINSMNTAGTVADVWLGFSAVESITQTATSAVETNFTLGADGVWRLSGNGRVAQAELMVWAWHWPNLAPQYQNSTRFGVYDPRTDNNVRSVAVSGPGVSTQPVPKVCDYVIGGGYPTCGNSFGGDGTQRGFQLDIPSFWPPVGTVYTLTITSTSGTHNYNVTVGNEYGFDASGAPVVADYPIVTLDVTPTLAQVMAGTTITGTIYVPIWAVIHADQIHKDDQLHFNYEGPGGINTDVSTIDINGQWVGTPAAGAFNAFTLTIPPATINSTGSCPGGLGGTCYNITFQGQTGDVQGGWIGFDANNEQGSSTNNGVEIQ